MLKKRVFLNYVAIIGISAFASAGTLMSANVQTAIEAWPGVAAESVRMLVTLPSLVSVPVMLVAGALVGKKLSYRFLINLGSALIIFGGVAPYFVAPDWGVVLLFRGLLGVGVGCYGVRNALIIKSTPPAKQAAYVGYGGVLINLCTVLFAPMVGALAAYGWRYPFLINLLFLLPGVLAFCFLKNPAPDPVSADKKRRSAWPCSKVMAYAVLFFIATATIFPLFSGMSTFVTCNGLGSAAMAGTAISVYCVGGVFCNLVLDKILRGLGKYTLSVAFLLCGAGLALILLIPSMAVCLIGSLICGVGYNIIFTGLHAYNGAVAQPEAVAIGSSILLAFSQAGTFASSYLISVCHRVFQLELDVESAFLGCAMILATASVTTFFARSALDAHMKR